MSLVALRNAIASELAAELAQVPAAVGNVRVSTHEGEFDLATLERCARRAPAVVVAFDRVSTEVVGGVVSATVYTVITIVTKNEPGVKRDVGALHLVKECLRVLQPKVWDVEGAKRGENFQAKNWYSEKLAKCGACLWTIVYTQRVDLLPESEDLDDFLSLHADWDLYPRNAGDDLGDHLEAQDQIDLDGP